MKKFDGYGVYLKTMAKGIGKDILPEIKLPIKRKPRVITKPYNREEDRLRPLIINALRKRGFKVYRVEPFTRGYSGMADLWIMRMNGSMAAWVEIKTSSGIQSEDQKFFQELCEANLIKYLIIRTPQEASLL